MTSLLDLGPLTEEVSINGQSVTVSGVTPEGFFVLLEKFPMLQRLLGGGQDITMESVREVAPTSIAWALALATTDRSRYETTAEWMRALKQTADIVVRLSAQHQITLFQTALRLTFPDGIGPFVQAMNDLAESINRVNGAAPAMTSRKPSRSGFVTDSRGMRLGPGVRSGNSAH